MPLPLLWLRLDAAPGHYQSPGHLCQPTLPVEDLEPAQTTGQGEGQKQGGGMSVDVLDYSDLQLETHCPGPFIDRLKGTSANCSRGRIYNTSVPDLVFDKVENEFGGNAPYAICPVCGGTGKVLAPLGEAVLDLVERAFKIERVTMR